MPTKKSLPAVLALLFTLTSINPTHAGRLNNIFSRILGYCCLCCAKDNNYDTFNEENEPKGTQVYERLTEKAKTGEGTYVAKPNDPKHSKPITIPKTKADDTKDGQTEDNAEKEGLINLFNAHTVDPNSDKCEQLPSKNNQST
jgi:hypothetical protein